VHRWSGRYAPSTSLHLMAPSYPDVFDCGSKGLDSLSASLIKVFMFCPTSPDLAWGGWLLLMGPWSVLSAQDMGVRGSLIGPGVGWVAVGFHFPMVGNACRRDGFGLVSPVMAVC
jgi:hypothetical protein